tara:strand:- start:387 stop:1865 length:1479 start_codon:yes stop_codon:yes gene_type:complete
MSDAPVIAKISAVINGGDRSAESLRFEMDINSFPVVRCNTLPPTKGVVLAPLSADVLDRVAELQKRRLAGQVKPDAVITADDGIGGSLAFSGYISAPILQMTSVNTSDQFSALGLAARVDALDLSIYRAGSKRRRKETSPSGSKKGDQLDPIPASEDGKVTATMKAITKVLVGNYASNLKGEVALVSKECMALRHEVNSSKGGPLALWLQMLNNSDVTFESWAEWLKLHPSLPTHLAERIKLMLISKTPGFWNKIRSLMASFQMHYVPSFEGPGKFERSDVKVADPEVELEVSASGISVSDGSARLLQPGGVTMMSPAAQARRGETQAPSARIIAYAPDPLLPGYIHEVVPPFWLPRPNKVPIMGSEIDERSSDGDGKVDLDLSKRKKREKDGIKFKKKVDTVSAGVMTELCEIIFKELQLAHSTAVLTMPLNFSVSDNIGKRATITILGASGERTASFTAFLSGVTHSVDLKQGKALNSSTQVRCTHVKYG